MGESAYNVGDLGSIPGLGRSPGEGKDYPILHSGLENSTDCMTVWSVGSQRVGHDRVTFTHRMLLVTSDRIIHNRLVSVWKGLYHFMHLKNLELVLASGRDHSNSSMT